MKTGEVIGVVVIAVAIIFFVAGIAGFIHLVRSENQDGDICLNHGFVRERAYVGEGIRLCCDLAKIKCKPFEEVKEGKHFGSYCDLIPECVELREKEDGNE